MNQQHTEDSDITWKLCLLTNQSSSTKICCSVGNRPRHRESYRQGRLEPFISHPACVRGSLPRWRRRKGGALNPGSWSQVSRYRIPMSAERDRHPGDCEEPRTHQRHSPPDDPPSPAAKSKHLRCCSGRFSRISATLTAPCYCSTPPPTGNQETGSSAAAAGSNLTDSTHRLLPSYWF
ncbi:unnamed protein product [Pleuronectes platessa]|uniref:Uncharacterized protein n=1 Tax=Pleuronectes platessa TaxID=8262 RepID=A0A9N7ZBD9_PLEPL|nr:unnamed protein product [Pleuronectes platessa]